MFVDWNSAISWGTAGANIEDASGLFKCWQWLKRFALDLRDERSDANKCDVVDPLSGRPIHWIFWVVWAIPGYQMAVSFVTSCHGESRLDVFIFGANLIIMVLNVCNECLSL